MYKDLHSFLTRLEGDGEFKRVTREVDTNIHLALLPSGGTYTMDNHESAKAALAIKQSLVISMHRWDTDPNEFKEEVEE